MDKSDIRTVYSLFQDVERSVAFLQQYQKQFLYDERAVEESDAAAAAAAAAAASAAAANPGAATAAAPAAQAGPEGQMDEDDDL